jgi:serine carboxypeptidase-like clade 1
VSIKKAKIRKKKKNKFVSISQMAKIIFLDQPVGSGFSYSKTPIDKTGDISEVKRTHEFLQKVIRET